MICPACDSQHFNQSLTRYDYSKECGIEGIVLESARRFDCTECQNVTIIVGQLEKIDRELFAQIASLKSPTMNADQLRFVRTKLFKDNFDQFSDRTGIDAMILHETEANDLKLNPELTEYVRGHIVAELAVPDSVSIQFMDKTMNVFDRKKDWK